ncbi:MAG: hypothetical protein JW803_09495 [Endomicrobiales bacterium]|nr:hypothetical protein [Endomicrobiales bacterium]
MNKNICICRGSRRGLRPAYLKNSAKKTRRILPVLLLSTLCALAACALFDGDAELKKLAAEMPLEVKVGQLFMVGNLGRNLSSEENFSKFHFGNVFLGHGDINRLDAARITELTAKLQSLAERHNGIPLLIATDQEGGRVNRVKDGVDPFPSQEEAGAGFSIKEARSTAERAARQLRALGINTNFSPVVDVNTNKKSHIAANGRSFGEDPETVAKFAAAYLTGYKKGGLIGCAKHFPGYGDVAPDPHKSLPATGKTLSRMETCELVPYKALIKKRKVDLIMTAHLMTPAVTNDENLPATISWEIMQGLLRDRMKYKGVIVTDDFNMGAMSREIPAGELAVTCVNSGVDILLFVGKPETQKRARDGVLEAVKDGRITKERLDESVLRILKLKKKYGLLRGPAG